MTSIEKIEKFSSYDYAWLDLEQRDLLNITNPLMNRSQRDIERPDIALLKVMRDPKYFGFTCKHLFDIDLLPVQVAILQELWIRPFPMFVASRGFGKSYLLAIYAWLKMVLIPETKIVVVGSGFRQSKIILEYMETIWKKAPILRSISDRRDALSKDVDRWRVGFHDSWAIAVPIGDGCLSPTTMMTYKHGFSLIKSKKTGMVWGNGKYRNATEFYDNGIQDVLRITTKRGYQYIGTHNHAMRVNRNGINDFVRTDELKVGDRILIDRSKRWHDGTFQCSIEDAYVLGCMIGDGCWTNKYGLRFTTNDHEHFIPILNSCFKKDFRFSDKYHYNITDKSEASAWKKKWGLRTLYSYQKYLPPNILSAPKDVMAACIQGLFDTDGTLQVSVAQGGVGVSVSYVTTSRKLIKQLHYILLHYGIISTIRNRLRKRNGVRCRRIWELQISGNDVAIFDREIGFRLPRKSALLKAGLGHKIRKTSVDDTVPDVLDDMLYVSKNYKQLGKCNPAICKSKLAAGKITFNRLDSFLSAYQHVECPQIDRLRLSANRDIYYDVVTEIKAVKERQTYDIHVPDGNEYCANGFYSHNSKIRGLRAHTVICDEFASVPIQIYETVIAGFGAVSASPIDNVKDAARRKKMKSLGLWNAELEASYESSRVGNQSIITGTADYAFKPFAQYHNQYQRIINSKGDMRVIADIYGGEENVPESFDWRNYAVIRIPYELIPEGFMDDKTVARAKATVHNGIFQMEYGAVFTEDSEGFFKRSLIESCVTSDLRPIYLPSGPVWFDAVTKGNPKEKYVYGVDPASENDNFTITVLQLMEDHTRVVYCWATNRKNFKDRQEAGLVNEHDYYAYCARKIRDLMRTFPPVRIGMDSQGGGVAVMEALHDPDKMYPGEQFLWPIINPDKPADTDLKQGLHIVELVNFASAEWTGNANHGMRKDMEDRVLLFPRFDPITLGLAHEDDAAAYKAGDHSRIYDSLEDCVMEIEELKDELAMIVMTKTLMGNRDRWDTPEVKGKDGKKGRLRKDRYSSLVIANMLARVIHRTDAVPTYTVIGGAAHSMLPPPNNFGQMYAPIGNHIFEQGIFQAVRRI